MSSDPRHLLPALALALLTALPPFSRAESAELASVRAELIERRDPDAAERFLSDLPLQSRLRAEDAESELVLFRAAAELKDLRDLLRLGAGNAWALRQGLAARPDCAFCQDAVALVSWSGRYGFADGLGLSQDLFQWETLSAERSAWLESRGVTPRSWAKTSFLERWKQLGVFGRIRLRTLMNTFPKTPGQLDALKSSYWRISALLDQDDLLAMEKRISRAEAAVTGLAAARLRLAQSSDPRLEAALKTAQNASDLEAGLAALSRVFDGLQVADPAVSAAAPTKPGQGFDRETSALVASMLGTALRREISGTWTGDVLGRFFDEHPISIAISPEEGGNLATYDDEKSVINFGQAQIEEFLRGKHATARDLLASGSPLFRNLVRELASTFVHESTHYRQDVWRRELGIPDSFSQYGEIEAMETEGYFILEKSRADPGFRKYLEEAAKSSTNAEESLLAGETLADEGPAAFRATIRADYYASRLSLEGETWETIAADERGAKEARAELERRARLSPAGRAALEDGPDVDVDDDDSGELAGDVRAAGTIQLREFLEEEKRALARSAEVYAEHRARFERVNAEIERRLRAFESGGPAPARDAVPPPGQRP